jgi:hypothetical protein
MTQVVTQQLEPAGKGLLAALQHHCFDAVLNMAKQ